MLEWKWAGGVGPLRSDNLIRITVSDECKMVTREKCTKKNTGIDMAFVHEPSKKTIAHSWIMQQATVIHVSLQPQSFIFINPCPLRASEYDSQNATANNNIMTNKKKRLASQHSKQMIEFFTELNSCCGDPRALLQGSHK